MITYRMAIIALSAALLVGTADAETEPKEITIYISGQRKAMVAALLEAIDEETTITGIANFDALSATYSLMGIDRTGRSSSFYAYQFRLTFPPAADIVAIAGAYGNLAYIQSVEAEPSGRGADKRSTRNDRAITRIPRKVVSGLVTSVVLGGVFLNVGGTGGAGFGDSPGLEGAIFSGLGLFFGYPIGIYLVDRKESSFWLTFIGNCLGWWGAAKLLDSRNSSGLSGRTVLVTVLGAPVLASELSRMDAVTGGPKRPKQSQDLRFSVGLVPQTRRGLSAVATLRF